jgi:hypothetical protein
MYSHMEEPLAGPLSAKFHKTTKPAHTGCPGGPRRSFKGQEIKPRLVKRSTRVNEKMFRKRKGKIRT